MIQCGTPLELITPHLADGAVVIIDDYANEALPGTARAVDEWRKKQGRTIKKMHVEHSLAILHC